MSIAMLKFIVLAVYAGVIALCAALCFILSNPFRRYYLNGLLDDNKFRKRAAILYAVVAIIAAIFEIIAVLLVITLCVMVVFQNHLFNSLPILFSLLGIVFFYSLLFTIYQRGILTPHKIRPELIELEYSEFGRLRNWSKATKACRDKIGWTERFLEHTVNMLNDATAGELIVIISPSANDGKIEKALADTVADSLAKKVFMYASDQLKGHQHVPSYSNEKVTFHYTPDVSDDKLKETYSFEADAIFDLKGLIWHSSDTKRADVRPIMATYYDLLKPGGIVIIDGYTHSLEAPLRRLAQWQLQLLGRLSWFAEKSTYSYFKKRFRSDEWLRERFEEHIIEDGVYTLVYYKKRLPS